jgi:HAD superfamily hydrolase (TIGR01509 family)
MLLIFDCDGTLVDSEFIALEVLSDVMGELGRPMSVAGCLDAFMGRHNADILREIERLIGRALPPDAGKQMRERMRTRLRAELQPVAGIAGVLERLEGPRCVASSSSLPRIAESLEITGLAGYFGPHVFSASQVENGKPAPDLFLFAAAQMGVLPHGCIVIEDSVAGVTAGVAAGMAVIGFTGASHADEHHTQRLEAAGAKLVIAAMAGLPGAIERLS